MLKNTLVYDWIYCLYSKSFYPSGMSVAPFLQKVWMYFVYLFSKADSNQASGYGYSNDPSTGKS